VSLSGLGINVILASENMFVKKKKKKKENMFVSILPSSIF
jgi:hypothetical protein